MFRVDDNSGDLKKILVFFAISIIIFIILWFIIKYVIGGLISNDGTISGHSGSSKVVLLDRPHTGKKTVRIEQNPYGNNKLSFISKSNNQKLGIEFTYSMWIYLDGYNLSSGDPKIIFYKGSNIFEPNVQLPVVYCPLIYLEGNTNVLNVQINTYENPSEGVAIPDIPINKWLNIVVAVNQINMDVYINGNLSKSVKLSSLPRQNNGDVFINAGQGFDGFVSKVLYFNKYLSFTDINNIVNAGPGKIDTDYMQEPRYLANSFWY